MSAVTQTSRFYGVLSNTTYEYSAGEPFYTVCTFVTTLPEPLEISAQIEMQGPLFPYINLTRWWSCSEHKIGGCGMGWGLYNIRVSVQKCKLSLFSRRCVQIETCILLYVYFSKQFFRVRIQCLSYNTVLSISHFKVYQCFFKHWGKWIIDIDTK